MTTTTTRTKTRTHDPFAVSVSPVQLDRLIQCCSSVLSDCLSVCLSRSVNDVRQSRERRGPFAWFARSRPPPSEFLSSPLFSLSCLSFLLPSTPSPFPHPPTPALPGFPSRSVPSKHSPRTYDTLLPHGSPHSFLFSLARSCPLELRPPLLGSPLSTFPSRLTRLQTSTQMTHKHGIARRGPHRHAARGYQLTEDFGPSSTPGAFSRLLPFRG